MVKNINRKRLPYYHFLIGKAVLRSYSYKHRSYPVCLSSNLPWDMYDKISKYIKELIIAMKNYQKYQ